MRPLRVLVVEDNVEVAKVLLKAIPRHDAAVSVEAVRTLAAALARLAGPAWIDAVLLDLRLPDADGLAALEEVRRLDAHMPVVVLTGLANPEVESASIKAGADDFFDKGQLSIPYLVKAVRHAVVRAEVRRSWEPLREEVAEARKDAAVVGQMFATDSAILKASQLPKK